MRNMIIMLNVVYNTSIIVIVNIVFLNKIISTSEQYTELFYSRYTSNETYMVLSKRWIIPYENVLSYVSIIIKLQSCTNQRLSNKTCRRLF